MKVGQDRRTQYIYLHNSQMSEIIERRIYIINLKEKIVNQKKCSFEKNKRKFLIQCDISSNKNHQKKNHLDFPTMCKMYNTANN